MNRIPNDFRQDYFDLRGMLEFGQYFTNERGEEVCVIEIGAQRAKAVEARLETLPHNVIIVQTERGRYQIEVGADMVITALDPGKHLVMTARMSNQLELTQRFD